MDNLHYTCPACTAEMTAAPYAPAQCPVCLTTYETYVKVIDIFVGEIAYGLTGNILSEPVHS